MSQILDKKLQGLKSQLDELIKDLHNLASKTAGEELTNTISELRNRINEPFMFVIVGEVKSGKSSFVNALLESREEICKVGPQPVTDTVQQILYGEEEDFITVNPHLKKIFKPIDILREIAIVDTPGTNTIIEEHQQITEQFIPASDLIVFVFEAKNPYRQSAWAFFDFIHGEWRKKVIFVLQQKDLMDAPDLAVNEKGVEEQAKSKGLENPQVFAVSAKEELEEKENSGFEEVRAYIRRNITGGQAPFLKLENNLQTGLNIHDKIEDGLNDRRAQFQADHEFRADIRKTLEDQTRKSTYQVKVLVENLIATYDRLTSRTEDELSSGLSFFSLLKRSITSIFSRKASAREWLDKLVVQLENDMHLQLQRRLDEGVNDLAENIQQMAKVIDLKIRTSKTILPTDHEVFSDIAEQRAQIVNDLQESFSRFMHRSENFTDEDLFAGTQKLGPSVATGSGIAVVGILLATVTQGMVFDITGGVLTTIGLLFAGFTSGAKKRKIIREYRKEVEKGRERLQSEVTEKLQAYIERIKQRIERNFSRFDDMLEKEETALQELEEQHKEIGERLKALLQEVQK